MKKSRTAIWTRGGIPKNSNLKVWLNSLILIGILGAIGYLYYQVWFFKGEVSTHQTKYDRELQTLKSSSQAPKSDAQAKKESIVAKEEKTPDFTVVEPIPYPKKDLVLSAIVASQGEALCMINDKILKKGDKVPPYIIKSVDHNYVLLIDKDSKIFKLSLN